MVDTPRQLGRMKDQLHEVYQRISEKLCKTLRLPDEELKSAISYLQDSSSYGELLGKYPYIFICLPTSDQNDYLITLAEQPREILQQFSIEMGEINDLLEDEDLPIDELLALKFAIEARFVTLVASKMNPTFIESYRQSFLLALYKELIRNGNRVPPQINLLIPNQEKIRIQHQIEDENTTQERLKERVRQKILATMKGHPKVTVRKLEVTTQKLNKASEGEEVRINTQIEDFLTQYTDPRLFFDAVVA